MHTIHALRLCYFSTTCFQKLQKWAKKSRSAACSYPARTPLSTWSPRTLTRILSSSFQGRILRTLQGDLWTPAQCPINSAKVPRSLNLAESSHSDLQLLAKKWWMFSKQMAQFHMRTTRTKGTPLPTTLFAMYVGSMVIGHPHVPSVMKSRNLPSRSLPEDLLLPRIGRKPHPKVEGRNPRQSIGKNISGDTNASTVLQLMGLSNMDTRIMTSNLVFSPSAWYTAPTTFETNYIAETEETSISVRPFCSWYAWVHLAFAVLPKAVGSRPGNLSLWNWVIFILWNCTVSIRLQMYHTIRKKPHLLLATLHPLRWMSPVAATPC